MSRRISRRAFIAGGGAVAAGVATAGVIASRGSSPTPPASPSPEVTPSPAPSASPTPARQPRQGGSATLVSPAVLDLDTFDVQLSGSSSVVEILGRTHSRLVNWDGRGDRLLLGDLAARWEQPDAQTVVFHLDRAARWHDKAPLNGRALAADDVVSHFRRSLELAAGGKAPLAQRYHDYAALDSVDAPEAGQVRFRLTSADPFFLGTLAGEYALVQAPEAVAAFAGAWSRLDSDHVVGTGPWAFDWADDGVKFSAARTGHRRAYLDEIRLTEPRAVAERFLAGELDEAIVRDRREAASIRARFAPELFGPVGGIDDALQLAGNGKTYEFRRHEREIVMSSFFVGAAPWNNPELLLAISNALGRTELADRLFGGRASISRPVPPGLAALDEAATLEGWPGDRLGDAQGAAAIRRQWEAAGGPGLGTITIDFPSVFDPLFSASSVVVDSLNAVLGAQFRPAVETYTTISKRVIDGYYGNGRASFWFGWGAPLSGPDRQRYLAETYAPGSPGQRTVGGAGIGPDATVSRLPSLGYLGIVPWVQQYSEVFRRPGHVAPHPSPFWTQHLDYLRSHSG